MNRSPKYRNLSELWQNAANVIQAHDVKPTKLEHLS
jgi:hypothetical protein